MIHGTDKNIFFLGKGGTGKTTISALTAVALAENGKKVALFSMDPAHNLHDVFQIKPSKKVVKIQERFNIQEIDIQYWIKTYLKSIEKKIAKSYQYLTALSLEKHINTIQFSPGLEEYALQYAYETTNKSFNDYNFRIFDMPPTALALRFFNLPKLSLLWLDQLIDLRKKILEKYKMINTVRQGDEATTDDKILSQLFKMRNDNQQLIQSLQNDHKTGIYIVLNEDTLSISESLDILKAISDIDIKIKGVVVNKYQEILKKNEIKKKMANLPIHFFPVAKKSPVGLTNILEYINNEDFQNFPESLIEQTAS